MCASRFETKQLGSVYSAYKVWQSDVKEELGFFFLSLMDRNFKISLNLGFVCFLELVLKCSLQEIRQKQINNKLRLLRINNHVGLLILIKFFMLF